MDLKSGYPWWAVRNGLMHAFPPLTRDWQCEVAVVGGGISAALIADELAAHGHDVAVFEQRDIAWGSTAASTALLQYEIDTHMIDLAKRYGESNAALAYRECAQAIHLLQDKAIGLGDVDFARAQSLYFASRQRDVSTLREEFALRAKHGFDVTWLEAQAVRRQFGFDAPGAILSALAARVDPYRMAYRLLTRLADRGAGVFDRSMIATIRPDARGVHLRSADGVWVHADYVVLAAGYANERWLQPRVARNRSTYAFITDPIERVALGPLADNLLWESARPYLYTRATDDGRLLVGGEDDAIDLPARRDRRVGRKVERLLRKMSARFPSLPLRPAFCWAGTFAETADGLPYFGPHPQTGPRLHFAMAYGGNGITYSMLGAGLICALLEGRPHPLRELFSFARTAA